jgi:hypothetical protein
MSLKLATFASEYISHFLAECLNQQNDDPFTPVVPRSNTSLLPDPPFSQAQSVYYTKSITLRHSSLSARFRFILVRSRLAHGHCRPRASLVIVGTSQRGINNPPPKGINATLVLVYELIQLDHGNPIRGKDSPSKEGAE